MIWLRICGDLIRIPAGWDRWAYAGRRYRIRNGVIYFLSLDGVTWIQSQRAEVVPPEEAT